MLFPAAPALTTPAPADRPLRWPSLARTGREHPLTPRPSPIDCLAVSPRGLTLEQGPAATERGKGGSRAGGRERSQRGAGLVRTLEEEGGPPSLLPAEAGCPWGLTQSDHRYSVEVDESLVQKLNDLDPEDKEDDPDYNPADQRVI